MGIYKWITLKYDKQIARAMKRYKKWQEVCDSPGDGMRACLFLRALAVEVAACTCWSGAQPTKARRAGRVRGWHERVDLRCQWRCRWCEAKGEKGEEGGHARQEEGQEGRLSARRGDRTAFPMQPCSGSPFDSVLRPAASRRIAWDVTRLPGDGDPEPPDRQALSCMRCLSVLVRHWLMGDTVSDERVRRALTVPKHSPASSSPAHRCTS